MSERSSSGVQGLRAIFEQNSTSTSPPSRGRSPADSVTSGSSRPLSKVRTSFISVERSGQQAPSFGLQRMNTGESSVGGDSTNEGSSGLSGPLPGATKPNGHPIPPASDDETKASGYTKDSEDGAQNVNLENSESVPTIVDLPPANPDKPVTGAEEGPRSLSSADLKDESMGTGGNDLESEGQSLGSVLKGSPFEEYSGQSVEPSIVTDIPATEKPLPIAQKPRSNASDKVDAQAKVPNGAGKPSSTNSNTQSPRTRPLAVNTGKSVVPVSKASATRSGEKANKSPRSTQIEKITNSTGKKPVSKPSSPRATNVSKTTSSAATQDVKAPAPSASRSSLAPQNSVQASKPRQPSSTASQTSTSNVSHPGPATKPRAKSPTRPVRLPSSATAATAASAAKAPSSRSPSRSSQASVTKPSRLSRLSAISTSAASARAKPAHSSLPAQSNASQKPKSRISTASTNNAKPAGGDFLARMMRPTESSASKVHEKVEVKSPPRKAQASKRKSSSSKESTEHQQIPAGSEETTHPPQQNDETMEIQAAEVNLDIESDPKTENQVLGTETVRGSDGDVTASQPVEQSEY